MSVSSLEGCANSCPRLLLCGDDRGMCSRSPFKPLCSSNARFPPPSRTPACQNLPEATPQIVVRNMSQIVTVILPKLSHSLAGSLALPHPRWFPAPPVAVKCTTLRSYCHCRTLNFLKIRVTLQRLEQSDSPDTVFPTVSSPDHFGRGQTGQSRGQNANGEHRFSQTNLTQGVSC